MQRDESRGRLSFEFSFLASFGLISSRRDEEEDEEEAREGRGGVVVVVAAFELNLKQVKLFQ